MPITSLDTYLAKRTSLRDRVLIAKNSLTTIAGRRSSLWVTVPDAGAAPTTAAVPTRATAGALGQQNGGALALRQTHAEIASSELGSLWLCDRLSHQGGLSGTAAGAQTTNLPTAALTRYTDGVGVIVGVEVYSVVGTTGTTFTCSYTNTTPTAGRTSQTVAFGAINNREVGRFFDMPLQQGDVGVRSVESLTLAASTTSVGNFGITLYKPLAHFPIRAINQAISFDPLLAGGALMSEILDDACLFWIVRPNGTASGLLAANLGFAEDDT